MSNQNCRVKHPTGDNAVGLPVPERRISKGMRFLKKLLPNETGVHSRIINKVCFYIQNDELANYIHSDNEYLKKIDLTAKYRLLAELLTD